MSIYIGWPVEVSDMQWPCPDGFHVPLSTEWQAIYDAWISLWAWNSYSSDRWTKFSTYLKMPKAGYRDYSILSFISRGSAGFYWSSTPYDADYAYYLYFDTAHVDPQGAYYRSLGFSVRCFKNSPTIPTSSWTVLYQWSWSAWIYHNATDWLISISSNGTTWYTLMDKNLWATTVYNYWDTLSESNCGKVYQRGNNYAFSWDANYDVSQISQSSTQVDVTWYWPWNYYESSTWITTAHRQSSASDWNNLRWWVSQWTSTKTQEVQNIYLWEYIKTWIFHNATLWLISISSDGTNWITISDKNLWATTVYNNWDTQSESNCGKFYQRWNNYWFAFSWSVSKSTSKVSTSSYWPTNYYSSSTFIYDQYDWSSSQNDNLRWNTTNTNVARKWPCDTGFHIPTSTEFNNVKTCLTGIWLWYSEICSLLKIPLDWYRSHVDTNIVSTTSWVFWTSTPSSWYTNRADGFLFWASSLFKTALFRADAAQIRPFKNDATQPDDSRTKLY